MATSYSVGLEFSAKTQQLDAAMAKLNSFDRAASKLKGQNPFEGAERGARGASTAVDGLERNARSATGAMNGLAAVAGRITAAFGGIALAQKAFQAGVSRIESERRLTALADAYGEVGASQAAAARAAQKFGISQTEANQSFAQIYARLRPIGTSLQDIETAYNGFNTAAKLAGANASEASSAWLQLSQALGSGVLRGEELNSVFEQTPGVVQAIAKEMNAPIGQIRQLAQDGKITSDIVIRALRRIETEGAGKLATALGGPQQKIQNLQNAFENLGVAITRDIVPAIAKSLNLLAGLINTLSDKLDTISGKSLGADLMKRVSKGNFAGMAGARSEQLDQYEKVLGLLNSPQKNRGGLVAQLQTARELSGRLRGINATGNPEADARIQALQGKAMGLIQTFEGLIQNLDKAVKPAVTTPAAPAFSPTGGASSGGKGSKPDFKLSSQGQALVNAANKLGVSPLDLATIISFETGGSFSPSKWGGAGGNYMGLIQFGPNERKAYGAYQGQSFEEQVQGPVVRYFQDRFKGVGMSTQGADLLTLYRTVLGGNPKANINGQDAFGTSPSSGVAAMGPHRQKALNRFFGGSAGNVDWDAADAGAALAEAEAQRLKDLEDSFKVGEKLAQQFNRELAIRQAINPLEREILQIKHEHADRQAEINELQDKGQQGSLTLLNTDLERLRVLEAQVKAFYDQADAAGVLAEKMQGIGGKAFGGSTGGVSGFAPGMPNLSPGSGSGDKLGEQFSKVKQELADLQNPVNQITAGAQAIGSAFGTAFKDVASGAKTAEQALADAFQGIANHFLDMASQMIAKWIEMQIIGLATSLLGGLGSPTGAAASGGYKLPSGGGFAQGFSMPPMFEGGGYTGDGARAGGLDGKGGFPAILHPGETVKDHRASSARAALKGGEGGAAPTINIQTGNVVQFEGANYVSMADFEMGLAKAANQGAERGHRKTLDKLRQSPGTRRSLGL